MVISTFLPIVFKYFTFYRTSCFRRCETDDLSNIAEIFLPFLSVTNEGIRIILPLLQEVRKANKPVQGRQ